MVGESLRTHAVDLVTDSLLAGVAFAGPAAAMLLPRLPQLGRPSAQVATLRLAYRLRWISFGAAATAMALLLRRRKSPEQRAALAIDVLALGGLLALAPRLYRTELGLTGVEGLRHLPEPTARGLIHDDAQVAGAFINGRAVAYPVALLSRSRPFVDEVGGVPLVPVVDRRSHVSIALVSGLDGAALDLVRLGTPDNHVLFYDRATGNAFRPLTGVVEAGPDQGARLDVRPLLRCTWGSWKALHPDTMLAWWNAPPLHPWLQRLGEHEFTARHVPEQAISRPLDPRLAPAELVFGIHTGGVAHAFTRFHLRKQQVISLRLGGRPVVVLHDPELDLTQSYFAELDGVPLSFARTEGRHAVARDAEQGGLWDVSGRCIKGDRYGRRLAQVPLSVDRVFWFAWALFHPHTGLDGWASTAQRYALESPPA
jgi:hypothetical protein